MIDTFRYFCKTGKTGNDIYFRYRLYFHHKKVMKKTQKFCTNDRNVQLIENYNVIEHVASSDSYKRCIVSCL